MNIVKTIHYCSFAVKLDRYVGSCSTLHDLSSKVCVPSETEDLYLSMFSMITGIYESKTLAKHISCECKSRFDGKRVSQINCKTKINVGGNANKRHVWQKDYV